MGKPITSEKKCKDCGVVKPIASFSSQIRNGSITICPYCRKCKGLRGVVPKFYRPTRMADSPKPHRFANYWAQIEPAIRDNLPSRVLAKAVVAQLCTLARIAIECEKGKQDQEIPTLETIEMRKREIQAQWNEETRERRSHGEDYDGLSKMLTLNHRHETREANQRQKTDRRSMERKRKSEME